jgi:transcriptional regulator with XRE-family HTH domain
MRSLSSRIRARRLELGLSQQALAHRAGLSPKWIERIESPAAGRINVKLASLLAIATALSVTPAWLIAEGEIKPERERPLGKFQRRLIDLAPNLATREARLLVALAEYLPKLRPQSSESKVTQKRRTK